MKKIKLTRKYDFSEELNGKEFLNFSVNYDFSVCFMTKDDKGNSQVYIKNSKTGFYFKHEESNKVYYQAQLLPNNEFILVNISDEINNDNFTKTAKVFNFNNELKREFPIGFAIERLQANNNGDVWVSYYDQAIFSVNTSIGKSGLVCFDKYGTINLKYDYNFLVSQGIDKYKNYKIIDTDGLNVLSNNEIYCCHWTEENFQVMRLINNSAIKIWKSPIIGFESCSIWEDYLLVSGIYQDKKNFKLFKMIDNDLKLINTYQFISNNGQIIENYKSDSRSDLLYLFNDRYIYIISIMDLVEML